MACCEKGGEHLSFEKAVKLEEERIKQDIWKGYLKRSKYIEQVKRYLRYFDEEQMQYILFEKFIDSPHEELNKVFEFLGVDSSKFEYREEIRNKTVIPRFKKVLRFARKYFGKGYIYRVVRKLSLIGKAPGYPDLDENLREELLEYFEEYDKKLKDVTGLETEIWH